MKLFNKVTIIGVGLIGGSIGLAIKKRGLAGQVVGVSRHENTISSAIKKGAIDSGTLDICAVRDSGLIILAAPVHTIIKIGTDISCLIKPGTLVIDTGSTKRLVVKKLEKSIPGFIGAHPLAGSEKQGVTNADAGLFEGSLCVLTPTKKSSKIALNKIKKFWIELGANVVYLSPDKHDRLIAYVSHLPHIIAFSLIHSVPRSALFFASTGLKDTTRIAGSSDVLWRDIFLTNSKNILASLNKFTSSLDMIKSAVMRGDQKKLNRILRQARLKRENIDP
ncbi:MAG: prephenate dehydrogenase [Candidatus Omnitrophota bacterium]